MSEIKDGGPAFPVSRDDVAQNDAWGGMTLRDYFAAKAMQAHLMTHADTATEKIVTWSYEVADAMLRARGAA